VQSESEIESELHMQNANVSALRLNGFFVGEREGEEEKSHYVKLLTNLMGNVQSESNKSFGVELRWCDWKRSGIWRSPTEDLRPLLAATS
jgi:hypothetical protein